MATKKIPHLTIYRYVLVLILAIIISVIFPQSFVQAQDVAKNAQVTTTSAGLTTRVAPGELLPVSVKLLNFGGDNRVDVLVQYEVFAANGKKILSTSETVAVETTNNFVKSLQIPFGLAEGVYTVKTSIVYKDQLVPATTEFSFKVEPKILGLFRSDFLLYSGVTVVIGAVAMVVGYSLIKHRKNTRLSPLDYSAIPRDQRVFYELISDTIMGMRQKVGDKALDVAAQTDDLVIDVHTGRVEQLTGSPSKIIAELVSGYEKTLGKKVSFSFRDDESKRND